MLDRDQEPRLRAAAPFEHRFYALLQRELRPTRPWVSAGLAALTVASIWFAADRRWQSAWGYVGAIVFILAAHELGHLTAARRHGISLAPPIWLPFPWLGTVGSVPIARGPFKTRRDLFDIALAGPLVGLLASMMFLRWGFGSENFVRMAPGGQPQFTGSWLAWLLANAAPGLEPGYDFASSHVLVAGRFGVFVASLNLLPGGVLDGSWLVEAVARRRRTWIAGLAAAGFGAVALRLRDPWWLAYSAFCLVPRRRLPPPLNPFLELGRFRWGLAVLALALLALSASSPRQLIAW